MPDIIQSAFAMRTAKKLAGEELFQYALRLLGGRALSAGEVRSKLSRRAERLDDIEPVIAKLREYNYIDDDRFAESYAVARSDSFGKARVMRDLRQRRVAPGVAEKAVDAAFADVQEERVVHEWLRRKYRNIDLSEYLKEDKHLASAYRKLRYAGFSSGASIRALKGFAVRAEELEEHAGEPD